MNSEGKSSQLVISSQARRLRAFFLTAPFISLLIPLLILEHLQFSLFGVNSVFLWLFASIPLTSLYLLAAERYLTC
ncbi:MAG: hypothetical protein AAYR33_06760 [Acetobacteraceae bacterium]